jgi:hypothetical protein
VLTINGTDYKFNTPQEYINKLQSLKSQGMTGPLDTFISQFQAVTNGWGSTTTTPTNTNNNTGSSSTPPSGANPSYSNLINKNGTIYNTKGITANTTADGGYASQDALMRDLGLSSASQIQWNNINTNNAYTPSFTSTPVTQVPTTGAPPATGQNNTQTPSTGGLQMPNLKQYRIGGTYYGYDSATGYIVAFATQDQLKQYFPGGLDANAPTLTGVDVTKANATPGTIISIATGAPVTPISTTPANVKFKDTAAYKALDAASREFVDMAFNLLSVGNEDQAKQFAEAIKQAKGIADPYYRNQLTMALGEIGAKIAELNNDYSTQAEIIARTKKELLEDVASQKDYLTLEQQSMLAREARAYDGDLLKIRDAAAEKGVTFGSGYNTLPYFEGERSAEHTDVVESANRQFNYQTQQLTLRAQRGDAAAAAQLKAITDKRASGYSTIGRLAETQLGSANVPTSSLPGYNKVGGILGTLEEQKRAAIIKDTSAFINLQKGFL